MNECACGYEQGRNSDCERCRLIRRVIDAEKTENYWRGKCNRMKRVCRSAEAWLSSLHRDGFDVHEVPSLPTSCCHHDLVDAVKAFQECRVELQCNTAIKTTAWNSVDRELDMP